MEIYLNWTQYKSFIESKDLIINYIETEINYELFSIEDIIIYKCDISRAAGSEDLTDFETNYKSKGNQPLRRQEKEQATVNTIRGTAETINGTATVLIKIPGTPGAGKRYIKGGFGFFENPVNGDYFKAYVTDEDNIMGYGPGTIVKYFVDPEADEAAQGWYISTHQPIVKLKGIADIMIGVSGLYFKIVAVKGDGSADRFYANIDSGKRS